MTLTTNMMYIILQAILFGIAASIVLGYFLSRAITTPITVLTEKAEDFAEGDFDSNLEITSKDEIGTLMETFNYMGKIMSGALEEISGEKHKIEIILEHVTNGIIAFNTEQNIIHINSAAKRLLGIENPEEVKFDEFFAGLDLNVCMAEFMYLNKLHNVEREFVANDKHIKMYFVPFKIENERVAGVVGVLEDITEQFNLENSRRKFVAEVSHELKTPLTTIGAYTETLLDGYLDDKETAKTFLGTIQDETIKMTNLVKNLLTLSRFDAQKIEMNREYFSIDLLLRELVRTFKVEADSRHLRIQYNLLNDIPDVYADKFQIERAVKNIISNAIKYTPECGVVKIFAGRIYNEAYIKVEDNGIGIPESDLPHIFDRFYRVDKARTRQQGGTGLGLSISKEIIDNHGGSIGIESEYGDFTRVTIKLPVTDLHTKKENNNAG
ncbi:MAG: HAMP domain-containing protein, partial [Bacilli bacterium]|nr:HAMP domain-containing protein [Bacilli bacterium]